MSSKAIFGVDLECVVKQNPNSTIPNIVTQVVDWLDKHNAIFEEGLFRIPGNGVVIQEIKKSFNEGSADLSQYTSADIHTIAGLLKLYLRELPEPLFIWRYYSTFIKVVKIYIYNITSSIPPVHYLSTHYNLLVLIFIYLVCTTINKQTNK